MKLRIGSRDSRLAVIQAQIVIDAIKAFDSSIETELVTMKTTGDKILNVTLDKIGGKGLFVKELDQALICGDIDLSVHSYKDMPMDIDENLPIVALSEREDPRDALICPTALDKSTLIGCSSSRRTVQLNALGYSNVKPLRGNVQTRLKKLDSGEYGAIVLAAAGLNRLQLQECIAGCFSVEEMLPAACQGILAVQMRKGEDFSFLKDFHSEDSHWISTAERAFVKTLDGGCSSPIAAYARLENGKLLLDGMYVDEGGKVYKGSTYGEKSCAFQLGVQLAKSLKEGAGRE